MTTPNQLAEIAARYHRMIMERDKTIELLRARVLRQNTLLFFREQERKPLSDLEVKVEP